MAVPPPAVPHVFNRHRYGVYSSLAMLAASQLDLFTMLESGPRGVEHLAAEIGAKPDKLRMLLYVLVQSGLLELSGEQFANTPESQLFLARGGSGYVGEWNRLDQDLWHAVLQTAATLRSGEPQGLHDFTAMSDAAMADFFAGLHGGAMATGANLAAGEDLGRFRHLLDVGGGSGGLAIGACQRIPGLRATVLDLPRITPIAQDYIVKAGLADRITAIAADLVAAPAPCSGDVAVMRAFLQVLARDAAAAALRNVGQAIAPGGMIFIIGHVLDDTRLAPPPVVGFNLAFLNVYRDGEAYCASEYRGWLEAAGFADIDVRLGVIGAGTTIIAARRAG